MITIRMTGNGIRRLDEAVRVLGEGKARKAFSRAINRVGKTAGVAAGRALSDQTGLSKATGKRALTRKVDRSTPATLSYTIHGQGGDIALKYFKARETRPGVSAAPWNQRRVYASSFLKAGWWPSRVAKPNWNGMVFRRASSDGYSYNVAKGIAGRKRRGTSFEVVDSGLFIPIEMVKGQTAAAWQREGANRLQPRIEHEIRAITKGVVS
ncbi:hypothetical protein [Arvimicrobium flavum]|uniref:hypothetical protein n=1 Tax=Arvimicrobium flavum TaxID=3393320 RepID=UPI00237AD945|nr:hypothetical protein [Mesorhizobium shangrilense]